MAHLPKILILNLIFLFSLDFFAVKDKKKRWNGLIASGMAIAGVIAIALGVALLLLSVESQFVATPVQMIKKGAAIFILGLLLQLFLGPKIK